MFRIYMSQLGLVTRTGERTLGYLGPCIWGAAFRYRTHKH